MVVVKLKNGFVGDLLSGPFEEKVGESHGAEK